MKKPLTEPVRYNLLKAATVPVKKWRLYAGTCGILVIAIVGLGIMLSEYYDHALLLFCLIALVVYVIGYRLEKKYLRTFTKTGSMHISSSGITITEHNKNITVVSENIQHLRISKDRAKTSRILAHSSRLIEYSYCVTFLLTNGSNIIIYAEFIPAFGYRTKNKHLIDSFTRLKNTNHEWYKRIFIDDDVHDLTTM